VGFPAKEYAKTKLVRGKKEYLFKTSFKRVI